MNEPGATHGITPVPGFLRPIDVDRTAKDLCLDEKGQERGAVNLPLCETKTLDGPEQEIVQRLEGELAWHAGAFLNHLRAYASRLAQFSIDAEFTRLQIVGRAASSELRSANHRAEADLGPLREHFVETQRELLAFQVKHGLSRPPRNPPRRWTSFGLLFVLVAFESVLNGLFFAKGASYGIIGGIGTAVGISIVNVALAFLLGLLPARWLHHRSFIVKSAGIVVLTTGLAAVFTLHAFAAHLRDATALVGEDHAMKTALETLRSSPVSLADTSSYYLFALGVLFAVLALWKGYTFDDPYPGYGSVYRRFAAAREHYSNVHADLFDDLEDIRQKAVNDLENGIARLPTFPQMASSIRAQRLTMIEQFRAYENSVTGAANQLLARYRDANVKARSTPPPEHFMHPYVLSSSALSSPEAISLMAEGKPTETDIGESLKSLKDHSHSILVEFEKLLAAYPHSTQISLKSDVEKN